MVELENSEWNKLQLEMGTIRARVKQLEADLEGAQKLVASMHAAAVGEVRGPALGVVEDVAAVRARMLELDAELRDADALVSRQADLLRGAVNALRGPPPEDTLWSHHDVADLAAKAMARVKELEAKERDIAAIAMHLSMRLAWGVDPGAVDVKWICDAIDARSERTHARCIIAARKKDSEAALAVEDVDPLAP